MRWWWWFGTLLLIAGCQYPALADSSSAPAPTASDPASTMMAADVTLVQTITPAPRSGTTAPAPGYYPYPAPYPYPYPYPPYAYYPPPPYAYPPYAYYPPPPYAYPCCPVVPGVSSSLNLGFVFSEGGHSHGHMGHH